MREMFKEYKGFKEFKECISVIKEHIRSIHLSLYTL